MNTILELDNLDKSYGRVHAVDHLSFTIEKGNVYGILGPNGSGKSTTLGMILNVVNPTSGSFKWFDGTVSTHDALKRVGAIIERPNFYPYMSAYQNLALVCKIKGINEEKIDEKLEVVHLINRRNDKFKTFSLGMKQRLAIASALLNDPEILILDEPTNGLDPKGINEIRTIIREISQKDTTILLASHLLDEVEKVCSHVIVLQNGKKLYDGPTELMSHSKGMVELKINKSLADVKDIITGFQGVESVVDKDGYVLCYLSETIEPGLFNKYLFDHGITASHIRTLLPTLEERFLDITKSSTI